MPMTVLQRFAGPWIIQEPLFLKVAWSKLPSVLSASASSFEWFNMEMTTSRDFRGERTVCSHRESRIMRCPRRKVAAATKARPAADIHAVS